MARRLAAGVPLTPAAAAALAEVTVRQTDTDEWTIQRHVWQLDRADYEQLDAIFQRVAGGGHYQASGHRFERDPGPELAAVLATGLLPPDPKLRESWFATPEGVADNLAVNYACNELRIKHALPLRVLEPSAGEGALADAMEKFHCEAADIVCVEPDPYRAAVCRAKGYRTFTMSFQTWAAEYGGPPFDVVAMNPPFTEPGNPTAWADHLLLAWTLLGPGGSLASIVPRSLQYRTQHPKIQRVAGLVDRYGHCYDHLDRGDFAPSGFGGHPLIVHLARPPDEEPLTRRGRGGPPLLRLGRRRGLWRVPT